MKKAPTFHALTKIALFVCFAALAAIGTACGSDSGTAAGTGGAGGHGGAGGAAGPADTAMFNFEGTAQNWVGGAGTELFTTVMTSTAEKFAGTSSLAGQITADVPAIGSYSLETLLPDVVIPPLTVLTFHFFVPAGAPFDWVQPYIQETPNGASPYRFTGAYRTMGNFALGAWTTVTVTTLGDTTPVYKVGVQFHNSAAFTGSVYVDSVNW